MKKSVILPAIGVVLIGAAGAGYYVLRGRDNLRQGSEAFQRGDLRAAQISFRNAVRENPKSGPAYYNLAMVEMRLSDPIAAEKDLRKAIANGFDEKVAGPSLAQSYLDQTRFAELLADFPPPSGPPDYAAHIRMARAVAELALKDLPKAQTEIDAAQTMAPALPDAAVVAAQVAMARHDPTTAEKKIDRALELNPKAPQALAIKGELLAGRGDRDGAIKSLDAAITADPNYITARLTRANLLLGASQDANAKVDIDAVLTRAPRNVLGLYFRGVLDVRAKDWTAADAALSQITQYLPNFPRGLFLAALVKSSLGQTEQAGDFADRYVARNPNDVEGLKLQARMAIAGKHYDQALAILGKAASTGKADAETLDLLGRTYAIAGQPQQAVQSFQKASDMAPNNADILGRLASARMTVGDASGAANDLEKSLQVAPKSGQNGEALVVAALASGDIPKAQAALGKLREVEGDSERVGVLSGVIKLAQADLDGARRDFEGVLKAYPKSIAGRLNLGRVAALQGRSGDAEQQFKSVFDQDPTNDTAISALVSGMLGAGRIGDAVAVLQKAHEANPKNVVLISTESDLMSRSGDADKAIAMLDQQPPELSGSPQLLGARARAQTALKHLDDAADTYRKILTANPNDLDARTHLTEIMLAQNNPDGARAVIEDGLKLSPDNFGMLETLTRLELRTKGMTGALALADRLAKDPTHQPEARLLTGDLYMVNKDFDKAVQAFAAEYKATPVSVMATRLAGAQEAAGHQDAAMQTLGDFISKNPTDLPTLQQLANLELNRKESDKAEGHLETIVAHAPRDAMAMNNLAFIYAEKKDPRGKELAQRAYAIAPTPEIADTYGWTLAKLGEPAAGVPFLRQAASKLGNNPAIQYHLGDALKATGQRDEAIRALTVATSATTDFPEKAAALQDLKDLNGAH